MRRIALATLLALALMVAAAARASDPGVLRVGTSGDYAPFSLVSGDDPPVYDGFDVAVARAYARDRGLEIAFVPFEWGALLPSLAQGRFDVAMSGITVTPERSAAGRFTVPVVETGAVVLVRESSRWPDLDALDRRSAHVGVNGGGYLERVASTRFRNATLLVIPDNEAVIRALAGASLDAVVTDTLEAPHWKAQVEGAALRGPFTRDRKAYLVPADRPELAIDLDRWLLAQERSGALSELRRAHLGEDAPDPLAAPLDALLAALDERLSLMPLVGVAKRRAGMPLEVPERESQVLDAAVAGALAAAARADVPPPPTRAVRALFRAQMEAAKQVQWDGVRDPAFDPPEPVPDIDGELRPALLRIGDRIAALLLELPADLDRAQTRAAAREALRTPYLAQSSADRIADALVDLSRQRTTGASVRAKTWASQPATSGSSSEAP